MKLEVSNLVKAVDNNLTNLVEKFDLNPKFYVLVSNLTADAESYLKSKEKIAKKFNIDFNVVKVEREDEAIEELKKLSNDPNVDAIFIEEPFILKRNQAAFYINDLKDVDGVSLINMYKLSAMASGKFNEVFFKPATAEAVYLIAQFNTNLKGKDVLVIGRSLTVGMPAYYLLLSQGSTVTVAHSKTNDLFGKIKNYDLVVVAVGKPELIKAEYLRKGQIVIDVGINVVEGKLVGDVEKKAQELEEVLVTPVPGGVGKLTTRILMRNVCLASLARKVGLQQAFVELKKICEGSKM